MSETKPGQLWQFFDKDATGSKWFIHAQANGDFIAGDGEYVETGCFILTLKIVDNTRSPSSDYVLALHLPSAKRIRIPSFYFGSNMHKCFEICP